MNQSLTSHAESNHFVWDAPVVFARPFAAPMAIAAALARGEAVERFEFALSNIRSR